MSLPERDRPTIGRIGIVAGLLLAFAGAGCTVQPLYGNPSPSTTSAIGPAAALSSIEVMPVGDRIGQDVRNHLIFMFGGGSGQPASPAYSLSLATQTFNVAAASVQPTTQDLEPTSEVVTVRTTYTLTDTATGETVGTGVRSIQSPYDVSRQAFAAVRARRDAENRAAREMAEVIRLAVAQDLQKPSAKKAPAIVSAPQELEGYSERTPRGLLRR